MIGVGAETKSLVGAGRGREPQRKSPQNSAEIFPQDPWLASKLCMHSGRL